MVGWLDWIFEGLGLVSVERRRGVLKELRGGVGGGVWEREGDVLLDVTVAEEDGVDLGS
jgi:hypothetical protein